MLRDACSTDAGAVARLPEGAAVRVRFSLSGDAGTCYKVETGGFAGYVLASELQGLESFQAGLRDASEVALPQMIRAETTRLKEQAVQHPGLGAVLALIDANQPRLALEKMEDLLGQSGRRDPVALALAGLAAYRSDQPRRALEFWTESQALAPNPSIDALISKAQAELTADTSRGRLRDAHFLLRYDESEVSEGTAARVLQAANEEYARLRDGLGCALPEQMPLVLQNLNAFRATTGAEAWSGGQFDGRIRVALTGGEFPRQSLAHELVHACLASRGRFPQWFHEGMAMRWSGERPGPADIGDAERLAAAPVLGPSAEQARLFYSWAWLSVERLYRRFGDAGVRALLRDPASITPPSGN